jgi:hypothetical protein
MSFELPFVLTSRSVEGLVEENDELSWWRVEI